MGERWARQKKEPFGFPPTKTSPYEFYQYFINVADADVLMVLRFLSDVTRTEYQEIEASLAEKPGAAQRRLAESLTRLVHSESGLQSALRASKTLFGAEIESLCDKDLNEIFADVPSSSMPMDRLKEGLSLIDARWLPCRLHRARENLVEQLKGARYT